MSRNAVPVAPAKPGYKTTEFWLSLAAVVLSAAIGTGLLPAGSVALAIATVASVALTSIGYTAARTKAKS